MRAHRLLMALAVVALAVASTAVWAGGGEVNLWFGEKNADLKNETEDFQAGFDSVYARTSSDTFSDLEDLTQYGLMTSWGLDWPVAIAADLFYASSDVSLSYFYSYDYYYDRGVPPTFTSTEWYDIDYKTYELDLGIRKYWGGKVQFLLGTGLAIASADVDATMSYRDEFVFPAAARGFPPVDTGTENVSDSATDFGLWVDAGFVWRAGGHFNLGLDVRYSAVNVDLQLSPDPEDVPLRFPAGGIQVGLFVGGRW